MGRSEVTKSVVKWSEV